MEPDGDGTLAAAAATSAARQLDQGGDERQEQLTEAAGPAVPEQAERGFPKFLLLPPEIQNMVWNEALDIVPRVHILVSRDRHLAPDALQGQALQDAADVDKLENHPGLQDEMNTLVAACQALGERHSFGWSVPGCTKYRPSFDTISSTLSQVCAESRRVFQEYRERRTMTRLMKWSKLSVDERDSIFCFRHKTNDMHPTRTTAWLLATTPRLAPTKLAIELTLHPNNRTFRGQPAYVPTQLPVWLRMALRWGRETREEKASGKQTSIKPPAEAQAINLENLTTLFLVTHGTWYRQHQDGVPTDEVDVAPRTIPESHCNGMARGIETEYYMLDPDNKEMLKHWEVPSHVLGAVKKLEAAVDDCRVKLMLMVAIPSASVWSFRAMSQTLSHLM